MGTRLVARLATVWPCILWAAASLHFGPRTVAGQPLEVEAPAELAAEAARVAALQPVDSSSFQELLGLRELGRPIRVYLIPESSPLARNVPRWIAGFARGAEDLVVLFPERIPTYPYSSLPELLRHEVAHVLIDRSTGGATLPRWFHEGLAMIAEGSWRMSDQSRLAMALLRSGQPELDDLSALFSGDEQRVAWAYAVSGAFVRDLLRRHGEDVIAGLLAAILASVDSRPATELDRFWRRSALWYRWLPIVTSSSVLWIAISLLALVAIRRRRARDRALLEQWEREEQAIQPAEEELVN